MVVEVLDEEAIFKVAVEIPAEDARTTYLQQVCGNDRALLDRVLALLRVSSEAKDFLESPPAAFAATAPMAAFTATSGAQFGHYEIREQIGEGGMGVVYAAEQSAPVRRKVALKIIKPGMDTRQVIARFEAERQALAMMDHPNIARVYDAGATDDGRPYFVMELVQGVPITDYCDQCNLTTRERLELFITVCQAVQHAHQKGVIHRDIKPTNVLVAIQDGRAAPKIIDFGVAKAVGQRLTEHTLTTAFAQMVGSPLYMSPEQAELSPLGVDTRSDIYSLGVLLYELLTGSTPFDKDRLHDASYDELRRIIREEEPPRPSARISTLAADLATTVAEHRRTDTRRLRQTVRGELDWIVMKCLEKDRNRRYETPNSLARDIERYLHDEPVQACPPSTIYRFQKFARRNKTLLAAGGAIAAALIIGLGLSTWMYFRAATESVRSKAVSDLMREMLSAADTKQVKGDRYTVRELLDEFSAGLGNQLADQPAAAADIHETIGGAYSMLNLPDKAEPYLEKAIELREQADGTKHESVARARVTYAWILESQKRYVEAESQLRRAMQIYRHLGVTGVPVVNAMSAQQKVLLSMGRGDEAKRLIDEARTITNSSREGYYDLAIMLMRRANELNSLGKFAEAEQLARESIDMQRSLPKQSLTGAHGLSTLSRALQSQQKFEGAEQAARESLAIFRSRYAPSHPNVRRATDQLKSILSALGDKSALESLAKEEAEQATRSDNPDNHVRLAGLLLANIQPSDAQKEEAHRFVRWAIEGYSRVAVESPNDFRRRMDATDGCARAIQICTAVAGFHNEVDELSRVLSAELPRLVADFPDSSQSQWEIAMCYNSWGRELFAYGDQLPTAEHAFRESNEILKKLSLSVPNRPYIWIWLASTYIGLGDAQWRLGRPHDAEPPLRMAMKIYDEHAEKIAADIAADPFPGINSEIIAAYIHYAFFLAATHKEDEAADFVGKATLGAKRLTDPAELVNSLWMTALAQLELGDGAGYRATCQALVDVPVASADDVTKSRSIWTWCLAPDALEDLSLPVKRAEEFVASNSLNERHFGCQLLGAALYRAGRYEQAAERLQESIAAYPSDPPPGFDSINYIQLLLAMTKWHNGQQIEARRLFAEARLAVDKELQTPSILLHRRATLEVLRREAEALIGQEEAKEAVENVGHTDKTANQEGTEM